MAEWIGVEWSAEMERRKDRRQEINCKRLTAGAARYVVKYLRTIAYAFMYRIRPYSIELGYSNGGSCCINASMKILPTSYFIEPL